MAIDKFKEINDPDEEFPLLGKERRNCCSFFALVDESADSVVERLVFGEPRFDVAEFNGHFLQIAGLFRSLAGQALRFVSR
ncbi:MAG: hypothetical protein KDJ69_00430 [Nitratireductor sp.]|nr:hypothetical protein [Nitratireductor sp.]